MYSLKKTKELLEKLLKDETEPGRREEVAAALDEVNKNFLNNEVLEDAKKWFEQNDIDVEVKDYGSGESLYIMTNDSNNFNIELSTEEIDYRAELLLEQ